MKERARYWDEKYALPPEEIPWEITAPPRELMNLLEVYPKGEHALDIACGTGNYSRFLASCGYQVTAIDYSSRALDVARSRSNVNSAQIEYIEGDVTMLQAVLSIDRRFDLILDYSLLHHLGTEAFLRHAKQFETRLKNYGVLLVVCYSEMDPYALGKPNGRGAFGNEMYYRTRACIADAYSPLRVLSYQTCTLGKQNHHQGHSFVFGH